MIGWSEIYKVLEAMVPLYVALLLGYGSVRWWHMFEPADCNAISRLNCSFILPFLFFHFVSQVNPYKMNFPFLASDIVAKLLIIMVLVVWTSWTRKGKAFDWSVTTFSLSTINNAIVVGAPLLRPMYGDLGLEIAIQSTVIMTLLWITLLLFGMEIRRTRLNQIISPSNIVNGDGNNVLDLEAMDDTNTDIITPSVAKNESSTTSFGTLMVVSMKELAKNPVTYASILGLVWALIANRCHLKMPGIVDQSILIMAKAGSGVSMFDLGLFMASQKKIISCGARLTICSIVLRFVICPATSGIGALVLRLHGHVFKVAIIQAALPPAVASFIYANQYGLHVEVASTSVIIGTIISLPIVIGYYAALDLLH